ncbi:MAG: phytoene desaturase family protein [Bacillota bacterium]
MIIIGLVKDINMELTLIIIGGGVAGLTAGCYARMNGYRTTILEMGKTPGGLCTSWRREGYLFDGSVAGLAGSAPGSPLFRLWEEIGVAKYCPLHYGENFGRIYGPDGRTITVYTDIDRLEAHLLSNFPSDARPLREFTRALRSVLDLDIPFSDALGWEALKHRFQTFFSSMSHLPVLLKYGTMTIRQFAAKFKDQSLVSAFNNLVHFGGPDVPLLTVLLPLAYAHRKMAGIPLKGWLSFARSIERRFIELGGNIQYGAKVTRLILENGVVGGVILTDGSIHYADRVLSAADGRFSQSILLGRAEGETAHFFNPHDISDQPVQVNIGVDADFSAEDGPVTYILSETFSAAGREHAKITVHNKYYDPDAAPKGKSAITVFLDSDYSWWKEVASDPSRYKEEKERCANMVIDIIGRYHPGFKGRVEVVDVSTPLTRERYTGNWMGAMQARKPNANMIKALLQGGPKYAYKDVKGLYMAGQWVEAWGGITTAALSGRKAIQAMCKHDRKQFTASKA